ncbi:helix-turn-helix domain-containing protein [Sunxiuqinia dokdonensis]|uniref:HTH cro/C1-type domain-containing protein n=1 Tax=Sunxiuqinia dokdonensis TaxID=1409788 RepID=A0A0L8VDR4_9BACT|nr:helix-turn-helix transcriptional regulator [Sunxiuqinia dokdonensis]KOH46307.1 hypothetical protein NC99_08440 [Sunxiuqinia dokdonensis]
MNNRIKRFMDYKSISSSELADTIGVQRSNVTHVLHGRNKPSFQFIAKLLETYPEINAKWLIMGTGKMLEHGQLDQQELFSEKLESEDLPKKVELNRTATNEDAAAPYARQSMPEPPPRSAAKTKEIERIVVFYSDQTFKEYGPSK